MLHLIIVHIVYMISEISFLYRIYLIVEYYETIRIIYSEMHYILAIILYVKIIFDSLFNL